ncbi:MAG: superinfection immunity protein [Planctomycetota bacterium]
MRFLNLFLGWTVIGWVVALAMAVSALPTIKEE